MTQQFTTDIKMPSRDHFEQDEQKYSWLGMLLDGYALIDKGVHQAIAAQSSQDKSLACSNGCAACCRAHHEIPVFPLEMVGVSWYAAEKLSGEVRDKLRDNLKQFEKGKACPFLVDDSCSVHPVRPAACRQFNVLGTACSEGEDAWKTRPDDVVTPIKKYIDLAYYHMLPFYGIETEEDKLKVIKDSAMNAIAQEMQSCQWGSLVDKMDQLDKERGK